MIFILFLSARAVSCSLSPNQMAIYGGYLNRMFCLKMPDHVDNSRKTVDNRLYLGKTAPNWTRVLYSNTPIYRGTLFCLATRLLGNVGLKDSERNDQFHLVCPRLHVDGCGLHRPLYMVPCRG